MPRFAANLSWLYPEITFLERFDAAAKSGFKAVEFLFPYSFRPLQIAEKLSETGLTLVLFNLPPGNFDRGDRGIAAVPGREDEFRTSVHLAIEYAHVLNVHCLHVMAGITSNIESNRAKETYLANLQFLLERTAACDLVITLEPINHRDFPGYFLTTVEQAATILAELNHPRLKIQFDWYHGQIMGGDLTIRTQKFFSQIGHIQIAGVPDRNEPDRGEINVAHLLGLIDYLGYQGWVGCEYKPIAKTEDGLSWLKQFVQDFPVPDTQQDSLL
jgi:2-dehydrotetronate isomerase